MTASRFYRGGRHGDHTGKLLRPPEELHPHVLHPFVHQCLVFYILEQLVPLHREVELEVKVEVKGEMEVKVEVKGEIELKVELKREIEVTVEVKGEIEVKGKGEIEVKV
ncbi:hypothetical protein EYF80_033151 [Liparis tanakae]|uniref:Uncharacterized protein n=1 Tax=Liparis tanakae TaxID=230148 RepID=A0A4Z2GVM9_9TELE|nr:hypothetical protein EYF80_033151 [Liparis tanakae]